MRRSIAVVLALGILAVLLLNAATALADSPATKVETALQMRSATTKTQGRLALYATLATADGQPVSDRTINFYEQVQFLGDRRAYLGSASTDASGQAILTYEPATAGQHQVQATFAGDEQYAPIQIAVKVDAKETLAAAQETASPLAGVGTWLLRAVGILLLACWATVLGVFVRTALGIWKANAARPT